MLTVNVWFSTIKSMGGYEKNPYCNDDEDILKRTSHEIPRIKKEDGGRRIFRDIRLVADRLEALI